MYSPCGTLVLAVPMQIDQTGALLLVLESLRYIMTIIENAAVYPEFDCVSGSGCPLWGASRSTVSINLLIAVNGKMFTQEPHH